MLVIHTPDQSAHAPAEISVRGLIFSNLEIPSRAEALEQAARDAGHDLRPPCDFGMEPILAVHDADYLAFLETAWARWSELTLRGPYVASHGVGIRAAGRPPSSIQGQVGWYLSGGSVPMDAGTWPASLAAAQAALTAAQAVLDGAPEAYAICRPPGHHAYRDLAGGFCYLNNIAIAAEQVVRHNGEAAILDIDVHHGNGTQEIFYERADVHCVSLHADPDTTYPFFVGHADETGRGAGSGTNLNLPYAKGAGDAPFLDALDRGLTAITKANSPVLLVALGFDAWEGDPQGEASVTQAGFREAGRRIAATGLRLVLVQEGGYGVASLGTLLTAFLDGMAEGRGRGL